MIARGIVAAHEALRGQFVAQVGQGIGFAVAAGSEGGAAGRGEVRPAQPYRPQLGVEAGDLGCEGRPGGQKALGRPVAANGCPR